MEVLTSIVDLPPTLLSAAGLPIPDEMQGWSVLLLLSGAKEGWPEEVFVQISESQVGRAVRTQRWKYGVTAPEKDPWNDVGSGHYVEEYLYDLYADPHELNNLAGVESHQEVSETMKERLVRQMIEAGEREAVIEAAPERPTASQLRVPRNEAHT